MLYRVDELYAGQACYAGKQPIESKIGPMPADEIENKARLFVRFRRQSQPSANLLLKQHGALRRTEEQKGVDGREIDTFVVEITRD